MSSFEKPSNIGTKVKANTIMLHTSNIIDSCLRQTRVQSRPKLQRLFLLHPLIFIYFKNQKGKSTIKKIINRSIRYIIKKKITIRWAKI